MTTSKEVFVTVEAPTGSAAIEAFLDVATGGVFAEAQETANVTVCLEHILPMPAVAGADERAVGVTFLRGERGPKGDPGPQGEPGTASVEALTKTDILNLF